MINIEHEQKNLCQVYGADYYPSESAKKVGISDNTKSDNLLLNGLRHIPSGDTCGWYIWAGEQIDRSPDFFNPLHVYHLVELHPELMKFLGLPPGWRFLVGNGHEDVWYDPKLLVP